MALLRPHDDLVGACGETFCSIFAATHAVTSGLRRLDGVRGMTRFDDQLSSPTSCVMLPTHEAVARLRCLTRAHRVVCEAASGEVSP